MHNVDSNERFQRGFSLIEILLVVAIIAILSVVALPAIGSYLRVYKIQGAAREVASEIQTARAKAIMKNVNYGVTFIVLSDSAYRYVVEDDLTPPVVATRVALPVLLAGANAANLGPVRTLPAGVAFGGGCAGFVANDSGFRFNRLGLWCDPVGAITAPCPALGAGLASSVGNAAAGGTVCLTQPSTGLTRMITVAPGGRVRVQP